MSNELRHKCESLLSRDLAFVQLVLRRTRAPRTERTRLAGPGSPLGRVMGEVRRGEWLCDFSAAEVLAWLDKETGGGR